MTKKAARNTRNCSLPYVITVEIGETVHERFEVLCLLVLVCGSDKSVPDFPLRIDLLPNALGKRVGLLVMEIHRIHPDGALFVSGEIDDWDLVRAHRIDTIIDLDGGIDEGIPEVANGILYVYFPMNDDEDLPSATKLDALGRFIASLVDANHVVLVHCLIGLNRSNLVAAMALTYLGISGIDAVRRLQSIQPAALYNDAFANYAASLPARRVRVEHIEDAVSPEIREE